MMGTPPMQGISPHEGLLTTLQKGVLVQARINFDFYLDN
jgi:hypothetical protein